MNEGIKLSFPEEVQGEFEVVAKHISRLLIGRLHSDNYHTRNERLL